MQIWRNSPLSGACDPRAHDETIVGNTIHVHAPAKLNLYLEVLGKRADEYHQIETLMLAIDLCDELSIADDQSGSLLLTCDQRELSTGPDNLVLKAARLLKDRTGSTRGAKILLRKRIPWGAGLGGGSSDAAATLAGLNELWELGLSTEQLMSYGSELGSDVPFFFQAPAALCTGRGEEVTPIAVKQAFHFVLVTPPTGLSTAEVYRELGPSRGDSDTNHKLAAAIDALKKGDIETLASCLHNRLQETAMRLCPAIAELHRRLQASDALACLMSGSGSSLFALCRSEGEAKQVADDLLSGRPSHDELARTRVDLVQSCF